MRIQLTAAAGSRSFDTQLGRFTDAEAIPCFCCGECCRRWQPLIGRQEVEALAGHLRIPPAEFVDRYTRPYPLDDEAFLLLQSAGACVFLQTQPDGRSLCSVHPVRPLACRAWDASLLRAECLAGLRSQSASDGLGVALPIYDDPDDAARFYGRLRTFDPSGSPMAVQPQR